MLSRLQVKNYVLIDSLDIEFPEGLVIITGQTGAGKSILLGALSLVLGSKADASAIAEGADKCIVEAQFDMDPEDEVLKSIFEENDLEWDGGSIVVRRVVATTGRSRSFVNDEPVSVQVLSELSGRLLDIHSQHQTLLLSDHRFQMDILDRYAGNKDLLSACSESYTSLISLKEELKALDARILSIERDREYNEAQFKQLDSAALVEGELEELEEEQKRLANAEEIKELLCECENLASVTAGDVELSLSSSLKEIGRRLDKLSKFIPSTEALSERLDSCRLEIEDIMAEVADHNERMDASPERLAFVEDRLSLMYTLLKKHACSTVSELIALRDELGSNLADSSALQEKREELAAAIRVAEAALCVACDALHEARAGAAAPFADAIRDSIRSLEMPLAVFEVELQEAPLSARGSDSISFRFSATGRNAVDVAKCASGGEMSRIMLALKDMMARFGNMPTMIFDEIDTGVSGSVADKMGTMICEMGSHMRVFAITHLPQVAAKGCEHYLVSKSVFLDGATVSTIEKLSAEQRVLEVARMLSGSVMTDAAIANAKSLLGVL